MVQCVIPGQSQFSSQQSQNAGGIGGLFSRLFSPPHATNNDVFRPMQDLPMPQFNATASEKVIHIKIFLLFDNKNIYPVLC